jgi:hypothetical protein
MENNKDTGKQSNINIHSEKQFQDIVQKGLVDGGIHVNASKGHGKTRLLFNMAQYLRSLSYCRVLIFDGSEAWLYGFSKIPVFTITERDITLAPQTPEQTEPYVLQNWNLVKLALAKEKDLLFRLKSRKPSNRGFFIRTIINYLDSVQRDQRESTPNNQPKQKIAYFIEEAQDAFNMRSTMKTEAEEFLTVFNEGRNNNEAFYTCCQRETDFSKTIRTKQLMAYGKIPESDKTAYHRRLEKQYKVNFSELPQRIWFFEGKTFLSPEWKQQGKPYQINKAINERYLATLKPIEEKKPSFLEKLALPFNLFFGYTGNPNQPQPSGKANDRINPSREKEPELFRSVYDDREEEDSEIEEDGLIEDELFEEEDC